jgi:hypothetical protein
MTCPFQSPLTASVASTGNLRRRDLHDLSDEPLPFRDGTTRPELGSASLARFRSYGLGCAAMASMAGECRSFEALQKAPLVHGFPTGRRAGSLARICESPRQSVDQIRRRPGIRPVQKTPTKKPTSSMSNSLQPSGRSGLEMTKAGFAL